MNSSNKFYLMSESRNGLLRILKNYTTRKKIENQFMVPENISFDHEYYNDMIKKLKEEIKAKNKEIQLLKVSKTKKDDEYQRMMRVIQEIINKSDSSTIKGMQIIDKNFSEKKKIKSEINSNENISTFKDNKSSKSNFNLTDNQLPDIENMIKISKNHKKKLKEMIFINALKQEIEKKNEKIQFLTINNNTKKK